MKGLLTWIIIFLGTMTLVDYAVGLESFFEHLCAVTFSWVVAEVAQKIIESP